MMNPFITLINWFYQCMPEPDYTYIPVYPLPEIQIDIERGPYLLTPDMLERGLNDISSNPNQ